MYSPVRAGSLTIVSQALNPVGKDPLLCRDKESNVALLKCPPRSLTPSMAQSLGTEKELSTSAMDSLHELYQATLKSALSIYSRLSLPCPAATPAGLLCQRLWFPSYPVTHLQH